MGSEQDPDCVFLDQLEFLESFAGGPNEEGIAVVESGGDEGVDELLGIRYGEGGAESGDVFQVEVTGFAQMFDVAFKGQVRVPSHTKVGDNRGNGDILSRKGDGGYCG